MPSRYALSSFSIKNLGPIGETGISGKLGGINVFLGENSCGKTFILKVLYSACKVMETYNRGKEPKTLASLMKDKLYWIFQADPVGRIVHRDKQETATKMSFRCSTVTNEELVCSVNAAGRVTASAPGTGGRFARAHENKLPNSIFIPQKEVLTLYHIIIPAREDDQSFGFDETYYDLAKVIQRPPTKGKNFSIKWHGWRPSLPMWRNCILTAINRTFSISAFPPYDMRWRPGPS